MQSSSPRRGPAFTHQINNPLACVTTNLEFVRDELEQLMVEASERGDAALGSRLTEVLAAVQDTISGATRVRDVVRYEAGQTEELRRPRSRASFPRVRVEELGRRGRVLVIDDEPLVATAVKRVLDSRHDVVALHSARDAFGRIRNGERWDAIVCDLMMPDMTGMDFYAAVRDAVPEQAKRTLFLCGGAVTEQAQAFIRERAHRCATKPLDVVKLRDRVAALIGH